MAVCAVVLLGGFLLKAQCMAAAGWDGRQYSRLCYNDIQALYSAREIDDGKFPYVDGELVDQELTNGAIEYPVLTGVFMWLAGVPAGSANTYLVITSALLAPFALVTAYLLARLTAWRALLWSASPALLLYAFHNWDLMAVAACVAGVWFWSRERDYASAIAFGVGGAMKLYPAFLLAPLVLYVARKRGWTNAARVAGCGAATLITINLPFAVANLDGWFATYEFHSQRTGNFDSIWNLGFASLEPVTLNLVTGGLTALAFVVALATGWLRSARGAAFPFIPVAAAMVAAFLLLGKVHSPQYTLWLLPFFALVAVSVRWWIAYAIVDLAVYVGVFRWFYDFLYEGRDFTFFKKLMIAGVWGRAALCLALFVVFLRAKDAVGDPTPGLSHPVPRVSAVGEAKAAT